MNAQCYFTFENDWREAPLAFWVHIPVPGTETLCNPPAQVKIPHKGYQVLHVELDAHDLRFSSLVQLDHFIEVLARKPLPTSRQLASRRCLPVGPNGHWLSRLPAALKSPRNREKLVLAMRSVREKVASSSEALAFMSTPPL
jgi:hypothetical protein